MTARLCACPEPTAHTSKEPSHVHPGCLVYHTGATCAIKEITMSGNGREVVDIPPPSTSRQARIPGTEMKTIPTVHRAIEDYVEARDRRMALTKVEVEKKSHLLTVMKKHNITDYVVDGHEAHLEVDEQVKAKLKGEEDEPKDEVRELRAPRQRKTRGKDAAAGTD